MQQVYDPAEHEQRGNRAGPAGMAGLGAGALGIASGLGHDPILTGSGGRGLRSQRVSGL